MKNPADGELLRDSFKSATFFGSDVAGRIYPKLFSRAPEIRELFDGASAENQRRMLAAALHYVVMNYEHRSALENLLRRLGARHQGYGARPEHYAVFVECTLEALEETLGREWSPDLARIWRGTLGQIVEIMLQGYKPEGIAHAEAN